jgi:hypothetical protein
VAQAGPVTPPTASPHLPVAKSVLPPVAETLPDDLDALLDFEQAAPALPPSRESNPYRAPQAAESQAVTAGGAIRRVTYSEVLSATWQIFKSQGVALIGATLVSSLAFFGILIVLRVVLVGLASAIAALELGSVPVAVALVAAYLLGLYCAVVMLVMGYLRYCVLLVRGKSASLSTLFATTSLGSGALVILVMLVAIVLGSILLVVPGIVASLLLAVAPIALVDRECSGFEALKLSTRIMSANFLPGFLAMFSAGFGGNLLVGLTCGVGLLVVFPFQVVLMTVIYLRATGRRAAID